MRLHHRYQPVTRVRLDIEERLSAIVKALDLSYEDEALLLAEYQVYVLTGRPQIDEAGVRPGTVELHHAVAAAQRCRKFQLTDGELLTIMLDLSRERVVKHILRRERHPNNPGKGAGEE